MSLILFYRLHAEKWRTLVINGGILINRRLQKVGITDPNRLDGLVRIYVEINLVVPRFNWVALQMDRQRESCEGRIHESLCNEK